MPLPWRRIMLVLLGIIYIVFCWSNCTVVNSSFLCTQPLMIMVELPNCDHSFGML